MLTLAAPPAGGNGESCLWAEALELARRGVPVFPCRPIDKTPLCPHGFKNASCDPDIVHRWWTDRPDALIGVPTGVKFDVLDVDNGRHADAEKWLQENQHRLPLTRTHITRSGGRHFLFAPTPGLRCSSSRLGPHVDIRAEGGYVIMWPACGLEVLHGGTLATLPDWIPATLQPPPVPTIELAPRWQAMSPDRARRQLDGIIRVVAWASEGERNAKTFWGACRLAEMTREGFLSRNDAIAVAVEAASRAGLPRQEALRTAQSAFRKIIGA